MKVYFVLKICKWLIPIIAVKQCNTTDSMLSLWPRFVHCESCFLPFANFVQVIYPFALATTYFSMPQAVIPFQLNHRSFIISIFVIMATVRLLFALGTLLHKWKSINASVKAMSFNTMAVSPKTIEKINRFVTKGARRYTDDVELGGWRT